MTQFERTLRRLTRKIIGIARRLVGNPVIVSTLVLCISAGHLIKTVWQDVPDLPTQLACITFYLLLRLVKLPPLPWVKFSALGLSYWVVGFQISHDDAIHLALGSFLVSPWILGAVIGAGLSYMELLADHHAQSHGKLVLCKEPFSLEADDEVSFGFTALTEEPIEIEVVLGGLQLVLKDVTVTVRDQDLNRVITLNREGHVASAKLPLPRGRFYISVANEGLYGSLHGKVVVWSESKQG
jgi:hypothetical protein